MALVKQIVPLKAAAGVDTGGNPQVESQHWLRCENAVFPRAGALAKRHGFTTLEALETPYLAHYRGRVLSLGRGMRVHEGDLPAGGFHTVVDDLHLWDLEAERRPIPENRQAYQPTICVSGSIEVTAYTEKGGTATAWLEVRHRQSGRLLDRSGDGLGSLSWWPRKLVPLSSGRVCAVWAQSNGTTDDLYYCIVASDGTIGSTVDSGIAMTSGEPIDAWAIGDVVYVIGHDGTGVVVARMDLGASPVHYASATYTADPGAVAVWDHAGTHIVAVWWDATALRLYLWILDAGATLATVYGPATIGQVFSGTDEVHAVTGIETADDETSILWYGYHDTSSSASARPSVWTIMLDIPVPTAPVVIWESRAMGRARLVSRPWGSVEQRSYAWAVATDAHGSVEDVGPRTALLLASYTGVGGGYASIVGMVGYESCDDNGGSGDGFVSDVHDWTDDDGRTRHPAMLRQVRTADQQTIGPYRVDVYDPDEVVTVETDEALLIGGALVRQWDGRQIVEVGYLGTPPTPTITATGSTGGSLGTGTYRYRVTWQWWDERGQLHESAPSGQVEVTFSSGTTNTVDLEVPTCPWTNREGVRLVVWRTVADGTTFYRLHELDNDLTADVVAYTDTTDDRDIEGNAAVYTTGGVLENVPPPAGRVHCLHQRRHFVVSDEEPDTTIRYSKAFTPGVAVEHSDSLVVRVPADGGRITALASFLDRLLVFKADRIYQLTGTGLSSYGTGTGYSRPYVVTPSVGAVSQRGVVEVPTGLMFLGRARGDDDTLRTMVYGLSLKLAISALGEPVRYYTGTYTYRLGAVLREDHLALWGSSDGPLIVYDYLRGQWATWTGHTVTDIVTVAGDMVTAGTDDAIRVYDRTTYMDDTSNVVLLAESGWFSFAGLAGFQRVYRLALMGLNLGRATLQVAFQYDMEPYWTDEQSLDLSTLATWGMSAHWGTEMGSAAVDKAMILRADPGRQRVTSIRFRVRDSGFVGDDEGYILTGGAWVVGLKRGTKRLGAARRMS